MYLGRASRSLRYYYQTTNAIFLSNFLLAIQLNVYLGQFEVLLNAEGQNIPDLTSFEGFRHHYHLG